MSVPYTRRFQDGDVGIDVEAVARALIRSGSAGAVTLKTFNLQPERVRQRWGWRKRKWLRTFKRREGLAGDGYNRAAHGALAKHFDARAANAMAHWRPPVKLVEPRQGWGSLDRSMWPLYATAVLEHKLSDLGTYNGASRLPGGGISDHAKGPPALAIDLGIEPDVGMTDREGRAFFHHCVGNRRVEYVILGTSIWSRERAGEGIRPYTSGGHMNHAHVSGRHSAAARAAIIAGDLALLTLERTLA